MAQNAQPLEEALCLQALDWKDAEHWRWVLKDAHGKFLADHSVALDRADSFYPAFLDLMLLSPFELSYPCLETMNSKDGNRFPWRRRPGPLHRWHQSHGKRQAKVGPWTGSITAAGSWR